MPSHAVPAARIGFAALTFQVQPGATEIQLTPVGAFRARDGRPTDATHWFIDASIAAGVIAAAAQRANPFPIDYEHQTLLADKNGQRAPAAGWWKSMEWREGQGLFGTDVKWTAAAAAHIAADEYRFISPVFAYDKATGAVLEMRMAALTNDPGLDGMAAVAALTALFSTHDPAQESAPMDLLTSLLAALGLAAGTPQETALTAVAALKAKADKADTEIAALKSATPAAGTPDPAQYVPIQVMKDLQTEIAALKATAATGGAELLIEKALEDGRLLPVQKGWAETLGKTNVAALKNYLDGMQPLAALLGLQSQGAGAGAGGGQPPAGQLTETELAVCKSMGLSAEQYLASKGA